MSDDDDYMDIDNGKSRDKSQIHKKERSLTPLQLKARAQSKHRSLSKGRREGNEPPRLPYKIEPAEHIRLAKKINKRFKHTVNVSESDRTISIKKPKHLYTGKRSNGKNDRR